MPKCPKCGEETHDFFYCVKCGSLLKEECPNCKTWVDVSMKVCPKCRTPNRLHPQVNDV